MKNDACYICDSYNYRPILKKSKYSIVKCLNCDFVFTTPIPNEEEMQHYYKKFDYKDSQTAEKVVRGDAKRSLRIIGKYFENRGNLLDVGCGRGYFLDEARNMGWIVSGVDFSDLVTDYARNKLHLTVFQSDIFSFNPKQTFDLVTLNQVVEHFVDPKKLLSKCSEFLGKGGLLYIATPNIESISAKILKDSFDHYIPPEHVSYFSQHTLRRLLEKSRFKVLYFGSWSYPADLGGIIKAFLGKKPRVRQSSMSLYKDLKTTSNLSKRFDIKQVKSFLFDEIFCRLFYRLLNFDSWGINLEVLAQKV